MNWSCFATVGVVFAVALSACSTTESGGVTYDSAANTTIVTGRQMTVQPLAGPVRTLFLKAEISPGETGLYLVVLYLSVDGWLSADHVWDSSGNKLVGLQGSNETVQIEFNQVTKEIYYIPLTRRYLEAHRRSGFSIFLGGTKSVVAASQPARFVDEFLTSLNGTERKLSGEVIVKKLIPSEPRPTQKHHRRLRRHVL
ncbi:MAG TPA: hypothetical protein VN939_20030 [Chthoniobacterales bacterium]|jgi:hypothetical protein|nr:hypothetical protein [Chthoniobacterales bacterium]